MTKMTKAQLFDYDRSIPYVLCEFYDKEQCQHMVLITEDFNNVEVVVGINLTFYETKVFRSTYGIREFYLEYITKNIDYTSEDSLKFFDQGGILYTLEDAECTYNEHTEGTLALIRQVLEQDEYNESDLKVLELNKQNMLLQQQLEQLKGAK